MTVSIVVVSHSEKIADGAAELAAQMAPDVLVLTAGGTTDGRIGTSLEKVLAALDKADRGGTVILADLGSAVMTAESALEFAENPETMVLADAPLVEGLVAAYIPQGSQYRDGAAFLILITILLVSPSGLFGKSTVEKV